MTSKVEGLIVPRTREKKVYFIKTGTQDMLRDYLKEFCDPIFGSDVFVSWEAGDIYFITWRDLPKDQIIPKGYVQISQTGRGADIYKQNSRYTDAHAMVIKRIRKDGGSIEAGIRSFDHILEGNRGREKTQAAAVELRAYEIFDLFHEKPLSAISKDEFDRAEEETYAMLRKQKIDPAALIVKIKIRMVRMLLKGETGREAGPRSGEEEARLNWLISVGALAASYRAAMERRFGLDPIAVKYVRSREALMVTRTFCRSIFGEVADKLRTEALPSHILFKYPDRIFPGRQMQYVSGMLGTMIHELESFVNVKPYKPVGKEVAQMLNEARTLTTLGKRKEAKALLLEARKKLVMQLEKSKFVYPVEKIY